MKIELSKKFLIRIIGEHFKRYAHALRFAIGLHCAYKFHPIVKNKHYQISSGARASLMLYSLCMKFQAELVNFQDQLENRVLCKTFPSRQNSEVHPSVTTNEELKNVFE